MKIYIFSEGEPSVGINGADITIESNCFFSEKEHSRTFDRKILEKAFNELLDEKVTVRFEDECPNCGKILGWKTLSKKIVIKQCLNKNCPSN